MPLNIEQIENCLTLLMRGGDENYLEVMDLLETERARLLSGPYTLAEALASGRPFRRKMWNATFWYDGIRYGDIDCHSVPMFTQNGELDCVVELGDILTADYELMPEGGE